MAHEEISQIQRFIGDGSDKPTGVLPGSIYYEVSDSETLIVTYLFFDGAWYPLEEEDSGGE